MIVSYFLESRTPPYNIHTMPNISAVKLFQFEVELFFFLVPIILLLNLLTKEHTLILLMLQLILSACSPYFQRLFEEDSRSHLHCTSTSARSKADELPSSNKLREEGGDHCYGHPIVVVLPGVWFVLENQK